MSHYRIMVTGSVLNVEPYIRLQLISSGSLGVKPPLIHVTQHVIPLFSQAKHPSRIPGLWEALEDLGRV